MTVARLSYAEGSIRRERYAQDAKWGPQNYPDGTGISTQDRDMAASHKRKVDDAASNGTLTWRLILLEEVAEAFAENDPAKLRAELVQVAAVATAWIEDIDRRRTP